MEITCGYCNGVFTLDSIHIRKEEVKEDPVIKSLYNAILGIKISDTTQKHFLYCPKCHKKIARFDY